MSPLKRKRNQRSKYASRRSRFRPTLQELENRQLMAGDVDAFVSGGILYIQGDDSSNHIEVRQLANGSTEISRTDRLDPRAPESFYTQINGAASDIIAQSYNNIRITMGDGEDSVRIEELHVGWDLNIRLGVGGDSLDIRDVTVGDDLYIYTDGNGPGGLRDVVNLVDVHVGSSGSTHEDLVVQGTTGLEDVKMRRVEVEDDLVLRLTQEGEYDRTWFYDDVEVGTDSSDGYLEVTSDFVYSFDLTVEDDADFIGVDYLYKHSGDIGGDLTITGTNDSDDLRLYYNRVAGTAEAITFAGRDDVKIKGDTGFRVDGGEDDDTIRGGDGDDVLIGGYGQDKLEGMAGRDQLFGGANRDWLYGGDDDDQLFGGGGNDDLFGGDDDDSLYGSYGDDNLYGEQGQDGLFGGQGIDEIDGGTGADRILSWWTHTNYLGAYDPDNIIGLADHDALIHFKNSTKDFKQWGKNYYATNWTHEDVERADAALRTLHHEGPGTRLVKHPDGPSLSFLRWEGIGRGFINSEGIHLTDAQFDEPDTYLESYVIHEIAHNWQGRGQIWVDFKAESGWTNIGSEITDNHEKARSGWWYLSTAVFVSDYARVESPKEDWAETFSAFFMGRAGKDFRYGATSIDDVPGKKAIFEQWFAML